MRLKRHLISNVLVGDQVDRRPFIVLVDSHQSEEEALSASNSTFGDHDTRPILYIHLGTGIIKPEAIKSASLAIPNPDAYVCVWIDALGGPIQVYREFEDSRLKAYLPFLQRYGMAPTNKEFPEQYKNSNSQERCFDAALELSIEHENLTYFEGLVLFKSAEYGQIYLGHAWCVDEFGYVVDPILKHQKSPEDIFYVGVPFKKDYVQEQSRIFGMAGVLDPNGTQIGIRFASSDIWLETGLVLLKNGV